MIKRLAHVCFFTDNAEGMIAFYQEALGFPIAFVMKGDDGIPFGWYLECGHETFIEIFDQRGAVKQWGGEVVALKATSSAQYRHFCFESVDLQSARAELLKKGVEVTEIIKGMDNSYQCWIKDADGNDIELMQYTEDSLQFSRRGRASS